MQDIISQDYPSLENTAQFDAFKRKWQYLFAYAEAGFAKGYITCHMLTFIGEVRFSSYSSALDLTRNILKNDMPITCD